MNEIQINNQSLAVKEYQGQRVISLKDIDTVHNRPAGTASRNFKSNRKHFIVGEDYLRRNSSEAKQEFGITAPNGLILLTESGYLMIVKSFTDDLAWQVQRELVRNYFRVKEQSKAIITVEKGTPQQIELERKTYKSKPVLTLRDIETVTGITKFNLSYYLSESKTLNFVEGTDFDILKGASLRRYKVQNGLEGSIISSLTVVYKSTIDKFVEQGYITSTEAINTLKGYFLDNTEVETISTVNVPFLEQIQAFKVVSDDLSLNTSDRIRIYKQIYESAGLSAVYLSNLA